MIILVEPDGKRSFIITDNEIFRVEVPMDSEYFSIEKVSRAIVRKDSQVLYISGWSSALSVILNVSSTLQSQQGKQEKTKQ